MTSNSSKWKVEREMMRAKTKTNGNSNLRITILSKKREKKLKRRTLMGLKALSRKKVKNFKRSTSITRLEYQAHQVSRSQEEVLGRLRLQATRLKQTLKAQ